MDPSIRASAEAALGHTFRDASLLTRALTHASIADHRLESNERMEFLGDAILGTIVCEFLFQAFPHLLEGELTKIKSHVVSRRACAEVAIELGLDRLLALGKGMSVHHGLPGSVAAAVFEALVAALYLDAGLEVTRDFVMRHMRSRVEQATRLGHQYNFKSALQQALLRLGMPPAIYIILDEKGPDHAKCFEVGVQSGDRSFIGRWGTSKKDAEQLAALAALRELGLVVETDGGEPMLSPWRDSEDDQATVSGADQSD